MNRCPCGTTIESRTHTVGECETYKEERDAAVEEELSKLDVCDMEEFGTLENSEKSIAILGDRWWLETAEQDGDSIGKQFPCNTWKKRNERPNVGGVSIRSKNGAPSRKGRVVNGQMTKASNKRVRPPPPHPPPAARLTCVCASLLGPSTTCTSSRLDDVLGGSSALALALSSARRTCPPSEVNPWSNSGVRRSGAGRHRERGGSGTGARR